jgi:anti-sigma regulatory factor (Ser/Thr protein kinase)
MGPDASGVRPLRPTAFPSRSLLLDPQASALRTARSLVQETCVAAGIDADTADNAVVLTSETVTNAFIHGRSQARVTVTVHPSAVRVEVGDTSGLQPVTPDRDTAALGGRGMQIVRALADDWGVRQEPYGKTVWFEVHPRSA